MTLDSQVLAWARNQLSRCRLCPRRCEVNRSAGERGFCGCDDRVRFFMEYVGYGEEPELTPSHTLFLCGCSLRCVCCHTRADEERHFHKLLTVEGLERIVLRGVSEGAVNLNLLGGEPAVSLPGLLLLLSNLSIALPPVVWNTSMYCSADSLAATATWVSTYAADFKVWSRACSQRVLGVADYPAVAQARLLELREWAGERILLRHLLMPGHLDCCTRPILHWLAKHLPGCRISLQDYLPPAAAGDDTRMGGYLPPGDLRAAAELVENLGLVPVARLPIPDPMHPDTALNAQLARGQNGGVPDHEVEAEIVIAPDGRVFLKHPNRDTATATAAALRTDDEANGGHS